MTALQHLRKRTIVWLGAAALAAVALALGVLPGKAADPLRIGFGMALTGPLAPNGNCGGPFTSIGGWPAA